MKYESAWSNRHNCSNKNGHLFRFASKKEHIEIRKQHPKMKIALWICHFCNKVTQSM